MDVHALQNRKKKGWVYYEVPRGNKGKNRGGRDSIVEEERKEKGRKTHRETLISTIKESK